MGFLTRLLGLTREPTGAHLEQAATRLAEEFQCEREAWFRNTFGVAERLAKGQPIRLTPRTSVNAAIGYQIAIAHMFADKEHYCGSKLALFRQLLCQHTTESQQREFEPYIVRYSQMMQLREDVSTALCDDVAWGVMVKKEALVECLMTTFLIFSGKTLAFVASAFGDHKKAHKLVVSSQEASHAVFRESLREMGLPPEMWQNL